MVCDTLDSRRVRFLVASSCLICLGARPSSTSSLVNLRLFHTLDIYPFNFPPIMRQPHGVATMLDK
jgi:hypothetical protein